MNWLIGKTSQQIRRPGQKNRHPGMLLGRDPGSNLYQNLGPGQKHAGVTGLLNISSLVMFTFSILFPISSFAANKKVGTTGAQFLKIGAGARPTAMGDAFVGIADDVNSVYYNPAGLANIAHPELEAMHTQYFENLSYDFGAFAYPTDYGAFALSAATLKVGDIERRNNSEALDGTFDSMDGAYAISYSRNVSAFLSAGVTARYIQQKIDSESAGTWAGDIGLLRRMKDYPLSIGLAVRHLGQPVEFRNESDPLPTVVDLGVGTSFFKEKLKVGLDAKFPRDNDLTFGIGTEFRQGLGKDYSYALRGGYNGSNTDAEGSGLSIGAGLGYREFNFDFAWIPLGDLGNTFRYAAHIKF